MKLKYYKDIYFLFIFILSYNIYNKMNFEKSIIEKLQKNNLSNLSIQTYIRNLKKLNNNDTIKNFNFLKNPDEILNKISSLKKNTIKSYLISICSILRLFNDDNKLKKLYEKYYKHLKEIAKQVENIPSNEMNEAQKNNWLTYDELKEKQKELIDIVDTFKNKSKINEFEYNILLSLLILSFYLEIPPRRNKDFLLLKLSSNIKNDISDEYNYIDINKKEFIFNNFKTKKTEGTQNIKYNDKLDEIIKLYLKYRLPITKDKLNKKGLDIPFLVYFDGAPLWKRQNALTTILNKVFDKKIGSSMIRHIHNTYIFGDMIKKQNEIAEEMGHSLEQSIKYIKDTNELKK